MAQTISDIKSAYPLPAYNYRVTVLSGGDSPVVSFAEISGLQLNYEPVTYKHGLSFLMGAKIIPGMKQPIKLTLKRGVVKSRDFLHSWLHKTYTEPFYTAKKRDIVIDLCDENGDSVVRWTVQGAMPTQLDAPAFNADGNEVAIESMELVAHGLKVDYDP